MVRTFIFWVLVTLLTIPYAIVVVAASLFDRSGEISQLLCRTWAKWLLGLAGASVAIEGGEDVNLAEPRIYVSNHQSYFDVLALMAHLPGNARFVAKKSLEYIPFFGQAMRAVGTVIIDRKNPEKARQALMSGSKKQLGRAAGVIVFPEGTRSRDGALQQFKLGAFVLAIELQIPIIPIGVKGTREIMPAKGFSVRQGKIRVKIGKPISPAGMTMDDRNRLLEEARGQVEALLSNTPDNQKTLVGVV